MGNRAIITVATGKDAAAIYLHWNGGPESVLAFLEAAKQLGVRSPGLDPGYFLSRLSQVICNFFGGTESIGIGSAGSMDDGDNGRYGVGGDFKIVSRQFAGPMTVAQLAPDKLGKYQKILADVLARNRPIFNRSPMPATPRPVAVLRRKRRAVAALEPLIAALGG